MKAQTSGYFDIPAFWRSAAPHRSPYSADSPPLRRRRKVATPKTFDLDDFDEHENQPQEQYAALLQGIREGRIDMPDPMQWAAWILHQHELTPHTVQCARLVTALDAAYLLTCALSKMTKDKGFRIQSHASYWGDTLQLFYLCDESMHFLTMDEKCLNHVQGSKQASRVLIYRDFARLLLPPATVGQ